MKSKKEKKNYKKTKHWTGEVSTLLSLTPAEQLRMFLADIL